MKCEICDEGPAQGVTVYRVNEKGQPGIWRCEKHLDADPDPDLKRIVDDIEENGPGGYPTLQSMN